MKRMNAKRREYYLLHKGLRCPFCKGDLIEAEGDSVAVEAEGMALQTVTCQKCDMSWTDVYTLTDVAGINE